MADRRYLELLPAEAATSQIDVALQNAPVNRQRRVAQAHRTVWMRQWLCRRQLCGTYENLMVELNREDPRAYKNYMRMDIVLFSEILTRIIPHIEKERTNWREPLEPGLKLAVTLRHLATPTQT